MSFEHIAILIIAGIYFLTPVGLYKTLSLALFAEYCLSIGLDWLTLDYLQYYDGDWKTTMNGGVALLFAALFFKMGGIAQFKIQLGILAYHIWLLIAGVDPVAYMVIMTIFMIMQLAFISRGFLHAVVVRHYHRIRNNPDHHRIS